MTSGSSKKISKNDIQEDGLSSPFVKKAMTGLVKAVKQATNLPVSGTPSFVYYNDFPQYRALLDGEASKILKLIQKLIDQQNAVGNILDTNEESSVEHKFTSLLDINDRLLESVNKSLDIVENPKKAEESPLLILAGTGGKAVKYRRSHPLSWNTSSDQPKQNSTPQKGLLLNNDNDHNVSRIPPSSTNPSKSSVIRILSSAVIARPQADFRTPPDNLKAPFIPPLIAKPNALKSLTESFESNVRSEGGNVTSYAHPYQFELENLDSSSFLSAPVECEPPSSMEASPDVEIIDRTAQLQELVRNLKSSKEIAVDLEHHSYRTYLGLTCLIQLSTREQDYIIDPLALRDDIHLLNDIFTDPKIVKVFHGADSDLMWLQRDFGVYVVNLFDTGIAARALSMPRLSLSFLLQKYCSFTPNKEFQLADWRIRPLPQELIDYARCDTHYLLYIYDRLRQELAPHNLLSLVWQRARDLCLKRYEKPPFSESDYLDFYRQTGKRFNNRQLYALEKTFLWRDSIARLEDESTHYVLPNHMLAVVAEVLPREHTGVFACCNPVPPLIRKYVHDVHKIVMSARNLPLEEQDLSWKASVARTGLEELGHSSCLSRLDLTDRDDYCSHIPSIDEAFTTTVEERSQLKRLKKSISDRLKVAPSIDVLNNSSKALISGVNPIIYRICELLAATMDYNVEKNVTQSNEDCHHDISVENASVEIIDITTDSKEVSVSLLDSLTKSVQFNSENGECGRIVSDKTVILRKEFNKRKRQSKEENEHFQSDSATIIKSPKLSRNDQQKIIPIPISDDESRNEFRPFDYKTESQKIFTQSKNRSSKHNNYDPFSGYFDKKQVKHRPDSSRARGHRGGGQQQSSSRPMETGNKDGESSGASSSSRNFRNFNRGRGNGRGRGGGGGGGGGRGKQERHGRY